MPICGRKSPFFSFCLCLLITILTNILHCTVGAEQCETSQSQQGYALENSSYLSSLVLDYPACLHQCMNDRHCRSLTYNLYTRDCQLSKESRWSKPSQYKQKLNNIYMEMLRIPAEASSTPPETNTLSTSSPTSSSTAAAFNAGTFCIGKVGDYAHPTDCSKYATCANGILYERDCGSTVIPNICGLC